jgi:uncharacterized protein (TIGR03067 family)
MSTCRTASFVFVLLATIGAEQALGQPLHGDLAKLQGRWWTKTSTGGSGGPIVNVVIIEGDRMTTYDPKLGTGKAGEPALEPITVGQIRLDESVTPRTVDFINMKAHTDQLGDIKLRDQIGIYTISRDTVKLCVNVGLVNSRRPSKFMEDPRTAVAVIVWSRNDPAVEAATTKRTSRRGRTGKGKAAPAQTPASKMPKADKLEFVEAATVIGIADGSIRFKTAGGQTITAATVIEDAFDDQGNRVAHGLDLMVTGNVVDLIMILENGPGQFGRVKEARLVKGVVGDVVPESKSPATKKKRPGTSLKTRTGPGESYSGAIIKNIDRQMSSEER